VNSGPGEEGRELAREAGVHGKQRVTAGGPAPGVPYHGLALICPEIEEAVGGIHRPAQERARVEFRSLACAEVEACRAAGDFGGALIDLNLRGMRLQPDPAVAVDGDSGYLDRSSSARAENG